MTMKERVDTLEARVGQLEDLLREARLCTRAHALILTNDPPLRERGLTWMRQTDELLGLAPSGRALSGRRAERQNGG